MSINKKAICVGMMTCDSYYYDVDRDFLEKENSTASHIRMSAGGDATNVSIDLARMGFHSCLLGLIGNDFHGDGMVKTVTEAGVDPSYIIRKPDVETTMTMILYTEDAADASDRHCCRNEGGNALLSETDITDEMLQGADHLHYGSFGPLKSLDGEGGARLLKRAKALGLTTSLDVKGLGRDFTKLEPMLPYVDYFMPNLGEVSDLTGLTDIAEIRDFFKAKGIGCLCMKMAEKGVYMTDFEEEMTLPTLAKQEEIVDVMGAGDAFCAGFIAASLLGLSLREKGIMASLCSKNCLATYGASQWTVPAEELAEEAKKTAG
ncbi:MAG: carbohydrate kinase family protein [Lachnospiraceae bacterium]|nr:carbohydrate kinase family protein [Lachnospiraceae bacterium]